nr:Uma2 family endonuclease [Ornithinimicrobium sp. HY1793]
MDRYREAGTASYWVVDPLVPSITAWDLRDGDYVEVHSAQGAEQVSVSAPFPLEFTPDHLLRD